jgi:hypothetical protein
LLALLCVGAPGSATRVSLADETAADETFYTTQVKPLLAARCYACHGALKQEADLRLDTAEALERGGSSGPGIVAGAPQASLLLHRVASADLGERMPPEHEGEAFSTEQIEILRRWIDAGAARPTDEQPEPDPGRHWAFQPLVRPAIPEVSNSAWVRNPIDAFIARQHEQLGLNPAPPAEPSLQLRRLYLDLVGVPPEPEQSVRAIASPASASAAIASPASASPASAVVSQDDYAETVEALLRDPRHGQRWARHWMDIWRYSDWWGLGDELRNSQKHLYHWRDWIVENLNRDRSYAEMIRLMLAADEASPLDQDDLRATGFLARNYYLFNRDPWMEETVEHVGKALMGLTTNCAKCHDHKYDPIAQTDYYRLRAFFEPYHVRNDMVPGEPNLAANAIPRVFDGWPEKPTYRLIRGDEKQPDQSRVITPGVPQFLTWEELSIQPVSLPPAAWQPDRHPWVVDNHVRVAEQALQRAIAETAQAAQSAQVAREHWENKIATLDSTDNRPADESRTSDATAPAVVLVDDDFAEWNAERWQLLGGRWDPQTGAVHQQQDGPQHAALRWVGELPQDFEVTLQFRIRGGSQWRSVGISFDETMADLLGNPTENDSAQSVYVSAYAGGPKVQASFRQGAQWQYPGAAAIAKPIELDRSYELRLQVRDTLINVYLDQELVLVWRTPLPRRAGLLQFTTYDALATFEGVQIATLPPHLSLQEDAAAVPDPHTVTGAKWHAEKADLEWQVALAKQAWAEAEVESVRKRGLAAQQIDRVSAEQAELLIADAARAERLADLAAAQRSRHESQLHQHTKVGNKEEAVQQFQQAVARVQAAEAKLQEPATGFTPLSGAKWATTRFLFSGQDDPTIEFPPTSTGRRLALANWLTDPRHPLTARVAVNHLWSRHFGQPLVATVFDFGRKGATPTHPELLDWLAMELIESGWSMKHIHRLIVSSATYQMSSTPHPEQAERNSEIDRDNRFYWRRPAGRMESQVVRDSLLELAGQLDDSAGGPPIPADQQLQSRRRSLYFFHSNNERNMFLTAFDEASVLECYRREQSVVPQQALALANSEIADQLIPQIAARILELGDGSASDPQTEVATSDEAWIQRSFGVVLGRSCSPEELDRCQQAVSQWRAQTAPATEPAQVAQTVATQLVWVLVNHHDFVSIR